MCSSLVFNYTRLHRFDDVREKQVVRTDSLQETDKNKDIFSENDLFSKQPE